jgi:AcrR family transcriptional regulator
MGNRESLLAGAKRCLFEKGYSRTTARDIAAAAGTSLAAIGYHFRTTEALLNAALSEAVGEWGDELTRALTADGDPAADPVERFESIWARVIESFGANRPLWSTQFEVIGQLDHTPQMRRFLADTQDHGRLALASLFEHIDPTADERTARVIGSFHQALLAGVMVQYLVDPDRAPSARDLTDALRAVAAGLGPAARADDGRTG